VTTGQTEHYSTLRTTQRYLASTE